MVDTTPYDELDEAVMSLCRVVNGLAFGGLFTTGSCGGHESGERDPAYWQVTFQLEVEDDRPTAEAWLSLEFLAWSLRSVRDREIWLEPWARAPHLNEAGRDLRFTIEGTRPMEPNDLAKWIANAWHVVDNPPPEWLDDGEEE